MPGMARAAGGSFRMGADDGDDDERPVHEVAIGPFDIDVTEVTMAAYARCVEDSKCTPAWPDVLWPGMSEADHELGTRSCNAGHAERSEHPVNCVDSAQAQAYCEFVGKQLPSEEQWEYAARGPDGRRYPWGNQPPSKALMNGCGYECTDMFKGWGHIVASTYPERDDWPTTAPVGLFVAGASPFGALDMAGNVWEWTRSSYCTYPHEDCAEELRVLRGGGWINHEGARGPRTTNRDTAAPTMRGSGLGFRCVRTL